MKKLMACALALMLFRFSAAVPGYSAALTAAKQNGQSWAQNHITVTYRPEDGKLITTVK